MSPPHSEGRIARNSPAIVAAWIAACVLAQPLAASAQADTISTRELADLSLDELANLKVTSVFRRAERLARAPTLEFARVDAHTYAISARGFNNAIGNKLLVLIDGRTVYSPLFSGTFW